MHKPINLTPLSPTWTRRHRAAEVVVQVCSLLVITPLVAAHRAIGWALSKALP